MTEPKLEPCPLCGVALESVWGKRQPGDQLCIVGMQHPHRPEEGRVCALQHHVVWPVFYDLWNRRPEPTSLQKTQTTTGGAVPPATRAENAQVDEAALQRADAVIMEFTGVTLTRDDVWRLKRRVRTAITGRMG